MRQDAFVVRHEREWLDFEAWLEARGDASGRARHWNGIPDEQIPERYRALCQQLALARRRGYSPLVVARLHALMQRGHGVLYRAPPPPWRRALRFLMADFPRLVRAQRGCLWLSAVLFAAPMVGLFVAVQAWPELVHSVFDPDQLAQLETMYDPGDRGHRLGRESETDVAMFGYYILNNISIGFRTFASGLLLGVGSAFVLVFNGVVIGMVAGHLQAIGHGDPFWRFVAGHSAPELTAIVIAGAAGLRLGLALVAPGRRRRMDALIDAGSIGGRLCLGILAMLLFAAFVEAFWSSIGSIPAAVKYAVGAVLWALVLGWLAFGGRAPDVTEAAMSRHGPRRRSGKERDIAA